MISAPGSQVRGLTVEVTSATTVDLSWQDPELSYGEITSYEVAWTYTDCSTEEDLENSTTVTTPSATIEGLEEYWDYTFTVSAFNSKGAGESQSDPVSNKTYASGLCYRKLLST